MASAAKLNDYTAGATSEKRSQVFAQLKALYAEYKPAVDTALGTAGVGHSRIRIANVPREGRDYPAGWEYPSDRNWEE